MGLAAVTWRSNVADCDLWHIHAVQVGSSDPACRSNPKTQNPARPHSVYRHRSEGRLLPRIPV